MLLWPTFGIIGKTMSNSFLFFLYIYFSCAIFLWETESCARSSPPNKAPVRKLVFSVFPKNTPMFNAQCGHQTSNVMITDLALTPTELRRRKFFDALKFYLTKKSNFVFNDKIYCIKVLTEFFCFWITLALNRSTQNRSISLSCLDLVKSLS